MTPLIDNCQKLIQAYKKWLLGHMKMPEDVHPVFLHEEEKLVYFTLPMALNYQRNSYVLREWVTETYHDPVTKWVFDISTSAQMSSYNLREMLIKYKIALQPNKHVSTRSTIANTIYHNWWTIKELLQSANYDFLQLQDMIQRKHKKWFPYLSGPKIFHYRNYILWEYCDIKLSNKQYIDIAPDTHVIQSSIRLWVITLEESTKLSREQISTRWRELLQWSWINPIDMHSPLWFWSRNNFQYQI